MKQSIGETYRDIKLHPAVLALGIAATAAAAYALVEFAPQIASWLFSPNGLAPDVPPFDPNTVNGS